MKEEEILNNVSHRLEEVIERGRHLIDEEELSMQIDELRVKAERMIRKYPVRSVAAGLLTGYILGKLFSSED